LYALARQYFTSESDAQDLIQETLMRAWRNYSENDECTCSRTWLIAIMRNVVFEWHRASTRRVTLIPIEETELTELAGDDPGDPLAGLPNLAESQFRELLDCRIESALRALEPRYREVVLLSAAGGLSYREIAQVLDCPVGTVMSRMARARRYLRERLASFVDERGRLRGAHS
jgi:RNA polymerase sigma-70 factor (ECF subfamily)